MLRQVNKAARSLGLTDRDAGALEVARAYARAIDDDPEALGTLGPKLLSALDALGMTPRSRAALVKEGGARGPAASPLDELRKRRGARRGSAADLDATAP